MIPWPFALEWRNMMLLCPAVFRCNFFERVEWETSDLDVYIQNGAPADEFCMYLVQKEGYRPIDTEPERDYRHDEVLEVCLRKIYMRCIDA